jgi:predicted nucleic acid-binding protein
MLDRSDHGHEACVRALKRLPSTLFTVWPVVTEAMYLLGAVSWEAQRVLWDVLDARHIMLLDLTEADMRRMRALMEKYRDRPMDLADAALVAVAEREGIRHIFTLDRTDFSIYRPAKLGRFSITP